MKPRSTFGLTARLLISYAGVIVVGLGTAYLTVRLLLPPLFDNRMRMGNGTGGMMGTGSGTSTGASTRSALNSALNTALLVAILASAVASGIVAALVSQRLLRPLTAVRDATRRIAAGDYQSLVAVPREPELAALAEDVNTLAAGLGETEVRRTRLLGDVAHEMRTPLTALDGYLEGLIDGVLRPDPENLQAMTEELRRLHRLSDDLATLSRAEERRIELHFTAADLGELARRAAGRLKPQFDDAGIGLDVRIGGSLPVRADTDRVNQILTNLLGNALVATARGGCVKLNASRAGDYAAVTVSDDGVGLSETDLERIFERFYRAATATRRSPGSGVGLTIARNLARAHDGDIRAASAGPGTGSTFALTLPLVGAAGPAPATQGSLTQASQSPTQSLNPARRS